jgi:predicted RNA-binding protein with PUA-like domain
VARRGALAPAAGGPDAPRALRTWLLKTEPTTFSFDDLWRAPRRTTGWDGVRNHQAKLFLRDQMALGDLAFVYHSSTDEPAVVGVARVAGPARPDPTQFDPADEHHEPRATRAVPVWWEVPIQALARCPRPVPLAVLRAEPALASLPLLQRGQRLSVQPVERAHFERILALAGLRTADLGV